MNDFRQPEFKSLPVIGGEMRPSNEVQRDAQPAAEELSGEGGEQLEIEQAKFRHLFEAIINIADAQSVSYAEAFRVIQQGPGGQDLPEINVDLFVEELESCNSPEQVATLLEVKLSQLTNEKVLEEDYV